MRPPCGRSSARCGGRRLSAPPPEVPAAPAGALILASASPRRRELLSCLGVDFTCEEPDVCEDPLPGETPPELVARLARAKCAAVAARRRGALVLAADTVVSLGGAVLGKPGDAAAARDMLRQLSGREHTVFTGVCAGRGGVRQELMCATRVLFDRLSEAVIEDYVGCGEGLDKAGAYALQGRGGMLVLEVHGSVSSVIGLPLAQTRRLLARCGLAAGAGVPA